MISWIFSFGRMISLQCFFSVFANSNDFYRLLSHLTIVYYILECTSGEFLQAWCLLLGAH